MEQEPAAPRCEPKDPTQGGLHWVKNITGYHEPITAQWSQFSGGGWFIGGAWLSGRQAYSMGYRYIDPVTPSAEVEALKAERDAEHANLKTAVMLLDGAKAESATLRARVAALEVLVREVLTTRAVDHAEAHCIGWAYRARAALENEFSGPAPSPDSSSPTES